jgi:hypothetical protein
LSAAVAGGDYAVNNPPTKEFSSGFKFETRLAMLMFLVNISSPGSKGWGKDAYGANIKGYSSFTGCGTTGSNETMKNYDQQDEFRLGLIAAIKAKCKVPFVTDGLKNADVVAKFGTPGLSAQVSLEGWKAIPCFKTNDNLYTIIECREKSSNLNKKMADLLNKIRGTTGDVEAVRKATLKVIKSFHSTVSNTLH